MESAGPDSGEEPSLRRRSAPRGRRPVPREDGTEGRTAQRRGFFEKSDDSSAPRGVGQPAARRWMDPPPRVEKFKGGLWARAAWQGTNWCAPPAGIRKVPPPREKAAPLVFCEPKQFSEKAPAFGLLSKIPKFRTPRVMDLTHSDTAPKIPGAFPFLSQG